MENASKALLMAGGILIALLIISLLLLMITNIGDYQRTKDSGAKATQVAKFNRDFEKYTDDDEIKGTDIVSLINKIVDYNSRQVENTENPSGTTNYVDYNIKMSITISGLDKFNEKYAYTDKSISLFKQSQYTIGFDDNGKVMGNKIFEDLQSFNESTSANGITDNEMKYLSSIYLNNINGRDESDAVEKIKERLMKIDEKTYKDWKPNNNPTLDSIKKYSQYSEFKTSKFKSSSVNNVEYKNGQIQKLFFEFVE